MAYVSISTYVAIKLINKHFFVSIEQPSNIEVSIIMYLSDLSLGSIKSLGSKAKNGGIFFWGIF